MVFYLFMRDTFYMKRALHLAARAKGMTSPNPMVGAVLVKHGKIISEDYHRRPGTPHAEALVLANSGEKAKGATLYVNLEPCCHTEKRTPPCTRGIVNSGIKKVVVAMLDPNPKVSGMGVMEIRKAGIEVSTGIFEEEAKKLNEFYIKHMTTGRPFVVLKIAMTLDGKIATPEGQSKWITGEKARRSVHHLRNSVDAIMTAIGTVKTDNPQMTARIKGGKNPLRIVIDPNLEISSEARILQAPPETIIVTNQNNSNNIYTLNSESSVIYFKDLLDLNWLVGKLGMMGITSVLIEGGASLNAHALQDGIVDKIMVYIAPKIIGGKDSFPAVGGKTFKKLEEAYMVKDMRIRRFDEDILIEGYIHTT
jgi:diaminohydroxyphosphoribosylaminopyrimidine deaminase / 5-amino-6-(5-phosphoribosylamino)uracil reductase